METNTAMEQKQAHTEEPEETKIQLDQEAMAMVGMRWADLDCDQQQRLQHVMATDQTTAALNPTTFDAEFDALS